MCASIICDWCSLGLDRCATLHHYGAGPTERYTMTPARRGQQHCLNAQAIGPHPEEIKARIRMRGVTMSDLSRSWGYSEGAVRLALHGPYPKIERLIAKFLGTKPSELWPDRYDSKGHPLTKERAARI